MTSSLYGAGAEYALHSLLVLSAREAQRALQQFLASKSLADLGREFERKAPEQFLREAESWFQLRRSDGGEAQHGRCA